jgi:predicted Rossmann fold nucleotide-binding protein DprA/Smf involved in DNA uptake
MLTSKKIAVVGSREFKNWEQLQYRVSGFLDSDDDELVSGGALGADSMAQRFCKEHGFDLSIKYPKYRLFGKPATFIRNEKIAEASDLVVAFYQFGRFQEGGTANTAEWARKLGKPLYEFEEE